MNRSSLKRTVVAWAVYLPSERRIITGFRTRKDLIKHYGANRIPIGTVLVKMTGNYSAVSKTANQKEK